MEPTCRPDPLLARSVVVTGTHFSTTTLVGSLLATSDEFNLLHEPLNPEPTLSYDSLEPPRWYEYYGPDRYNELHDGLASMFHRGRMFAGLAKRIAAARSRKDWAQTARYAQRRWQLLVARKPAILKDPFLAFSALTLQQQAGVKIVWCLRHPGAFAESFLRKTDGFYFRDFASQAALVELLPDDAEDINRFARETRPMIEQAALLWRIVNGFALRHLTPDERTMLVRQEDFLAGREGVAGRLIHFAGGKETHLTRRFLNRNFGPEKGDHTAGSYVRRDPRLATMKWRDRLTPEEIIGLRNATGSLAAQFGYGEDSWPH